jgi:hypothetical protein
MAVAYRMLGTRQDAEDAVRRRTCDISEPRTPRFVIFGPGLIDFVVNPDKLRRVEPA